MSQYATAPYHGSFYYPLMKIPQPILRPVKTEGTDRRLSFSPPPMHERTNTAIQVTGVSVGKCCEVKAHSMQPYPLPPLRQSWSCSDGRFSTADCCCHSREGGGFYDATQYTSSMDLPPLKYESGFSQRASPRLFCSEDYDSISPDESGGEDTGLPKVLNKFKLDRPRTPGSESDISRLSTQSPELIPTMLSAERMITQSHRAAPPLQRSITRDTASERRKASRQIRQSPSPIIQDPLHSATLENTLNGAPLADITVPQLRTLIKKLPVPPHLDGKWEEYAVYDPSLDDKKDHRCTYEKCKYTGKKQLVQRHIEGVHLKMKQYHCPYCDSAFHQETCAVTHISSIHLKVFPFRCKYECAKRFNDVARRHRHYQETHGYVSKQTKRSSKSKKSQIAGEPA